MTCVRYDWGKMARDPKGNKLLRDSLNSFIPDMFPECDDDEIKEKIDSICPQINTSIGTTDGTPK